ncbi:hypothetical protein [Photobacterium carnosum]|uniref:Uncharacterized protein n=1 Tax=Photobacterium carnosum TaxID=2023717 RepID=A0A2N4USF2_9GAMM|nr:hypothetical protein [Photobacterium carnosum]PLC57943.1 hypothetical protein CIK00_10825 [Photobacterium carnosum]
MIRTKQLEQFKLLLADKRSEEAITFVMQFNNRDLTALSSQEAIEQSNIDIALKLLSSIPYGDDLSGIYNKMYVTTKDYEKAFSYGFKYLDFHDKKIIASELLTEYRPINKKGKKIISYSLFGNNPKYIETAILNLIQNKIVLPDWKSRFYISTDVPCDFIARAKALGSEILVVNDPDFTLNGTFWRFFVADDPTVQHYIVRDADSIISQEEASLVNEWVASGKPFHIIRDFPTHMGLIMGGMWGGISGYLPNVQNLAYKYINHIKLQDRNRYDDQSFLAKELWKYIRNFHCSHDKAFGFLSDKNMTLTKRTFDDKQHIGMCSAVNKISFGINSINSITFNNNGSFDFYILNGINIVSHYVLTLESGTLTIILPNEYIEKLQSGLYQTNNNYREKYNVSLSITYIILD